MMNGEASNCCAYKGNTGMTIPNPTRSMKTVMKMITSGERFFSIGTMQLLSDSRCRTLRGQGRKQFSRDYEVGKLARSNKLMRATKEIPLERYIALLPHQRVNEDVADAAMKPGKGHHRVRDHLTEESSVIELRQSVGGMLQFTAETIPPEPLVCLSHAVERCRPAV